MMIYLNRELSEERGSIMKKRREYTPEYKASLILEILREENTLNEIAYREKINPKQLGNWKQEFIKNAGRVFAQSKNEKLYEEKLEDMKETERDYQAKVGQLTLEVDFLKKKHEQVYGPGWETKVGFKK